VSSRLVGREAELAQGAELLLRVPARSAVLLVTGEAGIGKTSVVDSWEDVARSHGLRVLRGACAPFATDVPYAPLQAALPASPAGFAGVESVEGAAARADWFGRFDATLASTGPPAGTMLVVEDAHWADRSTLGYLAHLTRNLPPTGLLLVVTVRDDDLDPAHETWLTEQLRCATVSPIPLQPLTADETRQQVRLLRPDSEPALGDLVHARSGGNPYLTAELATGAPDGEPTPTLRQVLRHRLRDVGDRVARVVAAAGLLPRPVTDAELAAATGDEAALRLAYDRGLLVRAPGVLPTAGGPRHPVLAEAAYSDLTPADRQLLHAGLARHLESSLPPQPTAAALAEIAEQHSRAGHPDDTLLWAVRAGDAAAATFGYAEAGRWYAQAVAAWPEATVARVVVPSRTALAVAAGRSLGIAGRHDAVIAVTGAVLDDDPTSPALGHLLLHRGWARFVLGDTAGALADIERASAVAPPGEPALAGLARAQLAHVHGTCSRWPEAVAAAREAVAIADRSADDRVRGLAATVLGVVAILDGDPSTGLRMLESSAAIAARVGEPDDLALAGVCITDHYVGVGELDSAITAGEALRRDLRRLVPEGHWLDDMLAANEIAALVARGEWDRALLTSEQISGDLGFTDLELALVDVARGDAEAVARRLHRVKGLDRLDQVQFHVGVSTCRGAAALMHGRPRAALDIAAATAAVASGTDVEGTSVSLLLVGLRAAALLAAPGELDRLVGALPGAAGGPTGEAVRAQVDGERSIAAGAPDPEPWRRAVAAWDACGRPYEAAIARLRAAEALLAGRGHRTEAALLLAAASATARRLGARPLDQEITQLGTTARLRLPPRDSSPAGPAHPDVPTEATLGLTEREAQVLALVAHGRTNKEIGELLYMSPKTASVHVTHILQKLGVRTRVQAAAVAGRHGLHHPVTAPQRPPG